MKIYFVCFAWILFVLLTVAIFMFNIYLWAQPLDRQIFSKLFNIRPLNLSDARNYYTIVYYGWTSFIAFCGLVLGLYYYFHKKSVDSENSKKDRRRKRLESLISELNKIDDEVHQILSLSLTSSEDLNKSRIKVNRIWENFEILLGLSEHLLGLNRDEAFAIVKVYSFVEKSDVLMLKTLDEIKANDNSGLKNEFVDIIQTARRTCYLKME